MGERGRACYEDGAEIVVVVVEINGSRSRIYFGERGKFKHCGLEPGYLACINIPMYFVSDVSQCYMYYSLGCQGNLP